MESIANSSIRPLQGLYTILCLVNGRQYIGSSSNVQNRLSKHKQNLRQKIHHSRELQHDFNRYGMENFSFERLALAEYCENRKEREAFENTLLRAYPNRSYLYNKRIDPRSGERNPFYGKTHTDEAKVRIGLVNSQPHVKRKRKPVQIAGIQYPSIAEAARQTGINRRLIREMCHSSFAIHKEFLFL